MTKINYRCQLPVVCNHLGLRFKKELLLTEYYLLNCEFRVRSITIEINKEPLIH